MRNNGKSFGSSINGAGGFSMFKVMFVSIMTISIVMFVAIVGFYVWAGVTAYNKVQENGGNVSRTVGTMYKDFKDASEGK